MLLALSLAAATPATPAATPAAAPAAVPAAAASAAEAADARCLASISYRIGVAKEADRPSLIAVAVFFAGKLLGRNPTIDFTAVLKSAAGSTTEELLKAETPRCAAELDQVGKAMTAAGEALSSPNSSPKAP